MSFCLLACSDPPAPPPVHPGPSQAPYVEWATQDRPIDRPIALFVDAPGGPLDRIAADFDVTTFLNDRFYPVFIASQTQSYARFFDPRGCALGEAWVPSTPQQWIERGNLVVQEMLQSRCEAQFRWSLLQDL